MYQIYNDLSGRQCSDEDDDTIDYDQFEKEYLEIYGYRTPRPPCPTVSTTTIAEIETDQPDINEKKPVVIRPVFDDDFGFDEYADDEAYQNGVSSIVKMATSASIVSTIVLISMIHFL